MGNRTNKIRGRTLGDFLKRDRRLDDNSAAAEAYNPGYPKTDDLALAERGQDRAARLEPNAETQDLSVESLKALSGYAESLTSHNKNKPSFRKSSSPSHERGEPVDTAFVEDSFLWGEADERTDDPNSNFDQRANFNTQAGGAPAGERLGSFFGAPRLDDLLSKTGRPGEPPSNYLLKDHSTKIGVKVGEVLEKVNLYSPSESSPYFDPDSATTDLDKGLWSVQTGQAKLGVNPDTNPLGTPKGFDKLAPPMTLGALRGLTLKLMLEASGEAGIDDMIDMSASPEMQLLGIIGAMNAAGLSPGAGAQLGLTPLVWDVTRVKNTIEDNDISGAENDDFKEAFRRLSRSTGADQFIEPGRPSPSAYTVNSLSDFASATFKGPYANLNSWAEPFAGAYPMGMFTASILGLLSMSVVTAFMDNFLEAAKQKEKLGSAGDPKNPSTYKMGAYKAKSSGRPSAHAAFMRLLGFTEIRSNISFKEAVFTGMKSLYGFDYDVKAITGDNLIEAATALFKVLDGAIPIAMSPGYYAVMQRTILRDVSATASGFESLIGAGVGSGLGVIAAIAGSKSFKALGVHGIIEIIGSSTIMNFFKICTSLGDIAYASKNTGNVMYEILDESGAPDLTARNIQEKIHTLTPALRIQLSRFHPGNNAKPLSPLSLMTHNAILLYREGLGPKPPTRNAYDVLNVEAWQAGRATDGDGGLMQPLHGPPGTSGRFNSSTVKMYEDLLDNEFTPFYIHDLRTNELISMPAFITSVGESFSPEWNETHGFGRTDPVRTYSKTTRTIDLSFTLVAMNEEDMQYMWFVINKLVSMCYPQRSAGQKRIYTQETGDKGSFIQPFSQVPTASPVVRLRLGELFHSNYSLTGLRRLFGDGTTDFDAKIDDDGDMAYWTEMMNVEFSDEAIHEELVAEYEELFYVPKDVGPAGAQGPGPGVTYEVDYAQLAIRQGGDESPAHAVGEHEYPLVDYDPGRYFDFSEPGTDNPKFKVMDSGNVKLGSSADDRWYAVQLYFDDSDQARDILSNQTALDTLGSDLTTINAWMRIWSAEGLRAVSLPSNAVADRRRQKEEESAAATQKAYDAEVATGGSSAFFSNKNAIVRSFQAAAGRGLAGVITNMTMNYDNATWGTDRKARDRAPKMVTISLGFAPIHDLPLGLDSHGELISPSHPVGKALTVNPHDLTIVPKPAR